MKRGLLLLLAGALALALAGCGRPNDLQMDVSQPYGDQVKLIHINGSDGEKTQRIQEMFEAIMEAMPTEKELKDFAYYPDFQVVITGLECFNAGDQWKGRPAPGAVLEAVVDLNGDWVDLQMVQVPPGETNKTAGVIYRAQVSAGDFKKLINVE